MKKLTILVVAGAFAIGMVSNGFAQGAGPKTGQGKGTQAKPGQGPGGGRMRMGSGIGMLRNDKVVKELGITDAQKKKLEAIQKEHETAMKPYQSQMEKMRDMDREKRQEAFKALGPKVQPIFEATQKKVDAVLTTAQKDKIKKMMETMRQGRGGGGQPPAGGGAGKGGKAKGGGGGGF